MPGDPEGNQVAAEALDAPGIQATEFEVYGLAIVAAPGVARRLGVSLIV